MDFKKSKDSYTTPECEVISFAELDIITQSEYDDGGIGSGNVDGGAWDN